MGRLLGQLSGRAEHVHLITRPGLERALPCSGVEVLPSTDLCTDLQALAQVLTSAPHGAVLLVWAEVATSIALLDAVLADPRPSVTALVGGPGLSWPAAVAGGVVTEAASPLHRLSRTSTAGEQASTLGVLRVPGERRGEVAEVALDAADQLAGAALPAGQEPADDALAVLLVALARGGCRVRTVPLRGFAWGRALDERSARRAGERLVEVDDGQARLDAAVKPDDGFFGTFFVSPYSKHLARAAHRVGLTPNQVTVTSMVLGAVAAALFAEGSRPALVLGALVAHAAFVLDCVDGQLARYAGAFSALGAYLDAVFDRVKEYLLYAGLAIGAARHGDDVWVLASLALLLQTVHHSLQFSWPGSEQTAVLPRQGPLTAPVLGERPAAEGVARVAVAVSSTAHSRALLLWVRRIVQFPIGERFAVITFGAALGGPRVVFVVFLALVGLALAWSTTGRLLRSVSR